MKKLRLHIPLFRSLLAMSKETPTGSGKGTVVGKSLRSFIHLRPRQRITLLIGAVALVVLVPLVVVFLLKPGSSIYASWFDGNWSYRQRIPVSNTSGSTVTDFQVELSNSSAINTSSLISSGKMKSDCTDIRFTDQSGKLLPYWIEPTTCNTTSTIVWIKVPSISSQSSGPSTNIYLYYGNPSANNPNYPTNQVFIGDIPSAVVSYPLDDTTTTQSYARVQNPGVTTGRNIVINGTFDSSTGWSLTGGNWTIANGVAHNDGTNGSNSDLYQAGMPFLVGKAYTITYTINRSAGSVTVHLGGNTSGTVRSASGTYTETQTVTGTPYLYFGGGAGFIGDIDNVSVTQGNIPASSSSPTQLLTDGDMEGSGTGSWTVGGSPTISKQTSTPHGGSQVLRIARSTVNDPFAYQANTLTVGQVYRATGYARSDGSAIPRVAKTSAAPLWEGTTSTSWQPFDFVFVSSGTAILFTAATSTGTQYVEFDDVVVSPDNYIRSGNVIVDGDMELLDTSPWSAISIGSPTISKQSDTPHSGSRYLRIVSDGTALEGVAPNGTSATGIANATIAGKTYRITGYARSDGTSIPNISDGTANIWSGVTSTTAWQYFDVTRVLTNPFRLRNTNATGIVDYDDVSVTEIDPLVGKPTNGVTLGSTSGGHLSNAYTFDGTNDNVNIYSSDLNSVFNPNEGTAIVWAKYTGSWSDGLPRTLANLYVDGNNYIRIFKADAGGSNNIYFRYVAGGTIKQVIVQVLSTDFVEYSLTWSKSGDSLKASINGVQVGTTQTGLGTWVGNLSSGTTGPAIGANGSTGSQPWSGMINDVRLYTRALTSEEIAMQYNVGYDTQNYYSENYQGHELVRKYNTLVSVGTPASEETGAGATLYWKMDAPITSSNQTQDSTANQNNGSLGGTTLPTLQQDSECVSGKCLFFDGVTSKVTGTKSMQGVQTISLWIRPVNTPSQGILNLDGGTHKLSTNTSGQLIATGFSSPTYYINGIPTTTPILTSGQWNHVEITTSTPFNSTNSFTLGTDGTTYTNSYIDEFKVYPYQRTSQQVLVDYNQGSSSLVGRPNNNFLTGNLVANWPLDDTTTTQSYARVQNPSVSTGRNIIIDGDMETSGTGVWASSSGGVLSKQTGIRTGGSGVQILRTTTSANDAIGGAGQTILVAGKTYRFQAWVKSDGIGRPTVGTGSLNNIYTAGPATTSWYQIDLTFVATSSQLLFGSFSTPTSTSDYYVDWDDIVVTQVNIPASQSSPTQLLADGDMETSGTGSWAIETANTTLTKETAAPHGGSQVLRVSTTGTTNPQVTQTVLTIGQVYRISGYARSDGTSNPRVNDTVNTFFGGSTSTAWQPFDVVFVAQGTKLRLSKTNAAGYVEFDDVVVSPDNYIRSGELLQDGNMEDSTTNYWSVISNATIAKDTTAPLHAGARHLRVTITGAGNSRVQPIGIILVPGKTYRVTGYVRGDGVSSPPRFLDTNTILVAGTNSTSWQLLDATFVAGTNLFELNCGSGNTSGYADFDDISVTEVDPLVGKPTNGVTLGSTSGGHLSNAYTFDGTNDNVNIYSSDLNSAFNPNEGTLVTWAKVGSSGVWNDLMGRYVAFLGVNSNNSIYIARSGTNNTLNFSYKAGGTSSAQSIGSLSSTSWMQLILTWSKSSNQVKAYINGTQVGSTVTGLGVWSGNLTSPYAAIGAADSTGTLPWSGMINDVSLYNRALTPTEISKLYGTAPGPVAYWKMDEGTGTTAADSSGNGHVGSITTATWKTGKYGKDLNFDGGDYVSVPNFGTMTQFTAEAWMRLDERNNPSDGIMNIFSGPNFGTNAFAYASIYTSGGNNGKISWYIGNAWKYGTTNMNDGAWHHIVYQFDNGAHYMWVDGKIEYNNTSGNGTYSSGVLTTVGAIASSRTRDFSGQLDDVKIYNYVRTPAQILDDMRGDGSQVPLNSLVGGSVAGTQPAVPIAYYKLDEQQGQTINNAGNQGATYNGTLGANSSPSTDDPAWKTNTDCKLNGCLNFDGNSDYVTTSDFSWSSTDSFTLSTWINQTSSATSTTILGKSFTTNYEYRLGTVSQVPQFVYWDTSAGAPIVMTSSQPITLNTWNHVVITYDGKGTGYMYLNGKQVAIQTGISGTFQNRTDALTIGRGYFNGSAGAYFPGMIDEVKIYNVALTFDEVRNDYNQGLALNFGVGAASESAQLSDGPGNPPVAYWNMDEKTGQNANDVSGNGNTATLGANVSASTDDPTWISGKYGGGMNFTNPNGQIGEYLRSACLNLPSTDGSSITASIWVRPSSTQTSANPPLLIYTPTFAIDITKTSPYTVGFRPASGGTMHRANFTSTIQPGIWSHIEIVLTQNQSAKLYINGILKESLAYNYITDSCSTYFVIGGSNGAYNGYQGDIDDVKVYNYARTPAQIAYDYNRGAPIAWYKLDECQGTAIHDSVRNVTGTLTVGSGTGTGHVDLPGTCSTGSTAWGNGSSGKYGASMSFDGIDDYIATSDTTNSPVDITTDWTLSAWIKRSGTTNGRKNDIVSKGTGYDIGAYDMYLDDNDFLSLVVEGTGVITSTRAITDANWHQVSVNRNSANVYTFFVDGVVVSTINSTLVPVVNNANLMIGANPSGENPFGGQIDDVKIWNYSLSPAQVKKEYNDSFSVNFSQ